MLEAESLCRNREVVKEIQFKHFSDFSLHNYFSCIFSFIYIFISVKIKRTSVYKIVPDVLLLTDCNAHHFVWFSGEGDRVRCFFCGGGLRDWLPDDIPLKEHQKLFPKCGYLELVSNNPMLESSKSRL